MKIFVIVQKGFQYDDQFYREDGLEDVVKAYSSQERAEAELPALNRQAAIDNGYDQSPGGNPVTDYYEVRELEVAEEQVEPTSPGVSYQDSHKKVEAIRKEMRKVAKKAFTEGCRALFAAHKELKRFSCTAYTPYFNDGEPCEFSVNCDYPEVNGVGGDEIDYGAEHAALRPLKKVVSAFLASFMEEDIRSVFGDGIRIVVTRPGKVKTEEYDHD